MWEHNSNAEVEKTMRAFKAKFGRDIKKYTIHRVKRDVKDQAQHMRDAEPPEEPKEKHQTRPRITNPEQDQQIVRVIEANNRLPWEEIKHILKEKHNIDVSVDTIIRKAGESGIKGYIPFEKPLLNKEKAKRRLQFARAMKARLREDPQLLYKLIFTDETNLRLFENEIGGNVYVRCRKDERL